MKKMILWTAFVALLWSGCQEDPRTPSEPPQKAMQQQRASGSLQGAQKNSQRAQGKIKKAQKKAKKKSQRVQKQSQKKVTASRMLGALPVRAENETGYDRDDFEHWSDLDGNGCDAREDVLRMENLQPRGTACWDDRGLWFSAYDGVRTRDSGEFDVDHMVPLAEAWDSGAGRWSAGKRERYANDLWPISLRAVTASSNRSKSDQDPAEWMPPRSSFHCRYALEWIATKYRWRLSVDPIEQVALRDIVSDCNTSLKKLPPRG